MGERENILAGLQPLFEQAERDGAWFFSYYQAIWLSPAELRAENAKGSFIWGSENWKLRRPEERLEELRQAEVAARRAVDRFHERMTAARSSATGGAR